jgi:hypothetical protein
VGNFNLSFSAIDGQCLTKKFEQYIKDLNNQQASFGGHVQSLAPNR